MSLVLKTANVLAMASGTHTSVTASDTVVTGLREVLFAFVTLTSDPVLTADRATVATPDQVSSPGNITVKTWMPTSVSNPTPIAATTFTKTVAWIAFGK